jgi:hypothetical protein
MLHAGQRGTFGHVLRFVGRALEALAHTNVIESAFATVRLRERVTKGAGSRTKGLLMAFKLLDMAQQRWRRLDGAHLLPLVRNGVKFADGVTDIQSASITHSTTNQSRVAAWSWPPNPQHLTITLGQAVLSEAESDGELKMRLKDILRRRVKGNAGKAAIATLLLTED